jgi:hypothetical protein
VALTGTPVENRLSDLWSIFDFTHPGLLGSGQAFAKYARRFAEAGNFGPLRELVRPYILSTAALYPFTFDLPLAYVIANCDALELRSEGPSQQFVALQAVT